MEKAVRRFLGCRENLFPLVQQLDEHRLQTGNDGFDDIGVLVFLLFPKADLFENPDRQIRPVYEQHQDKPPR
ncbi:hypothetical protein D1872_296580 [compost metagenome]